MRGEEHPSPDARASDAAVASRRGLKAARARARRILVTRDDGAMRRDGRRRARCEGCLETTREARGGKYFVSRERFVRSSPRDASRVERRRRRPFRRRGGHVDFGGDRPGRRLGDATGDGKTDATGSIEDASGARGEGARERNDDDFDVMC